MGFKIFDEVLEKHGNKMPFKKSTQESDIVVIVTDNIMMWGYIKKIGEKNNEGLRNVSFKLLALPPLDLEVNISDKQLDGHENFFINSSEAFMRPMDFHNDDILLEGLNDKVKGNLEKSIILVGSKTVN